MPGKRHGALSCLMFNSFNLTFVKGQGYVWVHVITLQHLFNPHMLCYEKVTACTRPPHYLPFVRGTTGHRWFPSQRPVMRSFVASLSTLLNNPSRTGVSRRHSDHGIIYTTITRNYVWLMYNMSGSVSEDQSREIVSDTHHSIWIFVSDPVQTNKTV